MGICGNRWRSAHPFLDRLPEDPSRLPGRKGPRSLSIRIRDSRRGHLFEFAIPAEAASRKSGFLKTEILTSAGEPGSFHFKSSSEARPGWGVADRQDGATLNQTWRCLTNQSLWDWGKPLVDHRASGSRSGALDPWLIYPSDSFRPWGAGSFGW